MSAILRLVFTILAVFSATAAIAAEPSVTLILPFDSAVMKTQTAMVLYQTPAGFSPILTMNEFVVKDIKVVAGNETDLHHLKIELKEGQNTLLWVEPKTDRRLLEATFFYVPLQSQKKVSNKNRKEYAFHQPQFEKRCNECHPMPEEVETVRGKPMTPAGKVCSSCHPLTGNGETPHTPTSAYDCFSCHETSYKPSRFWIRTSQVGLCNKCHQNFVERLLGGQKFVHGPVASGNCSICHDPHAGYGKGLIHEDLTTLCLRCHSDTVSVVVANSIHQKTPCTSCHSPHGSDQRDLTYKKSPALCLNCHPDPMVKYSGHPIQGHPAEADNDPSKPGRPMTCQSCHAIHTKPDISKLNVLEDTAVQREFCTRCHY